MSCLFKALATFLNRNGDDEAVRQEICNFLQTNPIMITEGEINAESLILWEQSFSSTSLIHYVEHMRKVTTYGGAIEIVAFTLLYKIPIRVHFSKTFIDFTNGSNNEMKFLQYNGNHYWV